MMVFDRLGLRLRKMRPTIPETQGGTKIEAAWFIDPSRTVVELTLAFLWFAQFLWSGSKFSTGGWSYDPQDQRELDTLDIVTGIFVGVHMFTILYYKWVTHRMWFLLQPCNMWIFGVTYVHFSRSALSVHIFNLYLHVMWGSWVGGLFADLRDYSGFLNILNFITLHVAIIVAPLYHLARGTFTLYDADIYGCGTTFIMYNLCFCLPLSLFSGFNINYNMCPPTPVAKLGKNYRILTVPLIYGGAILMRYGLVPLTLWAAGR